MTNCSNKKEINLGVYFHNNDYANFWLRLLSWSIDLIVLSIIITISTITYDSLPVISDYDLEIYLLSTFLICLVYLTIIKTTDYSTIGFHITNLKIINLYGETPTLWLMTFRVLLLFLGPVSFVIDLLWLTGEETKQTLRDKISGTYVVKNNSKPIGELPIKYTYLHFLGLNLLYKEVTIPNKEK